MSDSTRPTDTLRDLDDTGVGVDVPQGQTQPIAAHAVEHGLRLLSGRYLLQEKIASGGMASVWRARDEVLARTVAVKLLHDHLAADPDFRERFRREAISAAKLSHPFIVGIFDSGVDGDHVFLVMEFVEGVTLRDVIIDDGALSPGRAATTGEKIARALDYAHRRGLVHRDVKPANILLGNDGSVKVADFGIAKADQIDDLTKTGMVLGTAAYVAPEQIMAQPTDGKADQYSLGCVLYEMLTGRQPFKAETAVATAAQRLDARVPAVRILRPAVPPGLEQVVTRSMSLRPEDRFPSCGHLADVLAAYADGRGGKTDALPVPATAPLRAVDRPAGKPPRRPSAARRLARRMVLPVLGVMVFVLGLAVAFISGATDTTPVPESQPTVAAPAAELLLEDRDLRPFDPQGDDQEHGADLPSLVDSSRETSWRTETYSREDFGGVKEGVGFVIDLGEDATVDAVLLDVPTETQGFGVELRTADEIPQTLEDTVEVVPSRPATGEPVELRPGEPVRARYLVVWITGPLPEVGSQPEPFRASVSEVNVLGTRGAPAA